MDEVHRVIVGRRRRLEIGEVGGRALSVGLRRVLIASDALQDVRRHMVEMAGGRHHPYQHFSRRQRLLRMRRRFDRVDIIMVGAGMARIAVENVA